MTAEGPATVTLTDDEKRALRDLTFGFDFQARLDRIVAEIVAARVAALTAALAAARADREDWHDTAQKTASECGRQRARADEAERVIANVRALHQRVRQHHYNVCETCDNAPWPCDTARALPAAPTGEGSA